MAPNFLEFTCWRCVRLFSVGWGVIDKRSTENDIEMRRGCRVLRSSITLILQLLDGVGKPKKTLRWDTQLLTEIWNRDLKNMKRYLVDPSMWRVCLHCHVRRTECLRYRTKSQNKSGCSSGLSFTLKTNATSNAQKGQRNHLWMDTTCSAKLRRQIITIIDVSYGLQRARTLRAACVQLFVTWLDATASDLMLQLPSDRKPAVGEDPVQVQSEICY